MRQVFGMALLLGGIVAALMACGDNKTKNKLLGGGLTGDSAGNSVITLKGAGR